MMYFIDRYFLKKPKFRSFITRFFEGNKDNDVEVLGSTLRINTIKEHGYLRASRMIRSSALLRDEIPILIHLSSLFDDGDSFVDVGANVGVYSLTLAKLARIKSSISFYAFEASPDTYSRLSVHAEELGIKTYNVAISDKEGSLDFYSGAVSHVFTTIEHASVYSIRSNTISVPCKRLDQFDLQGDSIIIKIDVEGQEKSVLDGAVDLFANNRVKAVYLDGYKEKSIEEFLIARNFVLFDGKTLLPTQGGVYSLLAINRKALSKTTSNA